MKQNKYKVIIVIGLNLHPLSEEIFFHKHITSRVIKMINYPQNIVTLDCNLFLKNSAIQLSKGMNDQFWKKPAKRPNNPSMKSLFIGNLINHQPLQMAPSSTDFNKPVKLDQRPNDFMKRSLSQYVKMSLPSNPQKTSPNQELAYTLKNTQKSRMSGFGSSSLSKLPQLDSDVQVFQKQRKGRQVDIISHANHQYRDDIKVFRKYRFQTLDQDYWRRKSFIEGMPTNAYNHYSSTRLSDQLNKYPVSQTPRP